MAKANARTDTELEALLDAYELPLVRYAFRLTGELATARDVVQDVFLQLVSHGAPPGDERTKAWLFCVCRNRAIDLLRRRARESGRSGAAWDAPYQDTGLEACEQLDLRLVGAVAQLPALQQEVVWLRFVDELSYAQIGNVIGKTASHVGVILHNAMVELRTTLTPPDPIGSPVGGARHERDD